MRNVGVSGGEGGGGREAMAEKSGGEGGPGRDGGERERESGSRGSLLVAPTPFYNEALFARRKDTSADTTYTPRLFGAIDTPRFYSPSPSPSISLLPSHAFYIVVHLRYRAPSSRSSLFLPPFRLSLRGHLTGRYQRTARRKRLTKILHLPSRSHAAMLIGDRRQLSNYRHLRR